MNNQYKLSKSKLAFNKTFAVFGIPPTNAVIGNKEVVAYSSRYHLDDKRMLFLIEGIRNQQILLHELMLYITGRIVYEDGSFVPLSPSFNNKTWSETVLEDETEEAARQANQTKFKATDVFPVNNLFYSMIKEGTMTLQDAKFYMNDLAYHGYLETITNNKLDRDMMLMNQFYVPPTKKTEENQSMIGTHGKLFTDGNFFAGYTGDSNEIEMCGKLPFGICKQEKSLLSHVEVKIELTKHEPDFFLRHPHNNKKFKFVMTDCKLLVPLVTLAPDFEISQAEILQQNSALYYYNDKKLSVHSVAQGSHFFEHINTWQGDVPSRLTILMVNTSNYNGSYSNDPFCFKHNNLNYASFSVDNLLVGGRPMTLNINKSTNERERIVKSHILDAYYSTTENYPKMQMTRKEWLNIFPSIVFNINRDLNNDEVIPMMRRGLTSVFLKFDDPLPQQTVVIMYAEFPKVVEIDAKRNIIV